MQSDPRRQTPPISKTTTQPTQPSAIYVKRSVLPARTTGAAGTADIFPVNIPSGAVALIGWSINPTIAGIANAWMTQVQVNDLSGTNVSAITSFAGILGTKSAWGCVPIDPTTQQVLASMFSPDANISYTPIATWLMAPPGTVVGAQQLKSVSDDVTVTIQKVSTANAAQTVDIQNQAQSEFGVELLNAWFYNSGAGTATGNAGFWDGTTRVDFDTTVAVASYVFNVGAKGARTLSLASPLFSTNFRFVIGAGGVGVTTTLYVTYRIYPIR